jgi:hypothetical protein
MSDEELDDEFKPTPIKFPKVPPGVYEMRINVKDLHGLKNRKILVTLKRQEIAGFKIPQGTTLYVDYVNEHARTVSITSDVVNKMLKTLYLDKLRTRTKEVK